MPVPSLEKTALSKERNKDGVTSYSNYEKTILHAVKTRDTDLTCLHVSPPVWLRIREKRRHWACREGSGQQ